MKMATAILIAIATFVFVLPTWMNSGFGGLHPL